MADDGLGLLINCADQGFCRMEEALPVAKLHFPSHLLRAGHCHKFSTAKAGISDQGTAAGGGLGKGEAEALRMPEGK